MFGTVGLDAFLAGAAVVAVDDFATTRVRLLGCFVAFALAGLFSLSGESCGELDPIGMAGIAAIFRSFECEKSALCLLSSMGLLLGSSFRYCKA